MVTTKSRRKESTEILVDTIAFRQAVQLAATAALTKKGESLLSNLVLDFQGEDLWVSAFDYELAIARLVAGVKTEPRKILVPASLASGIAARLKSDVPTSLLFEGDGKLIISQPGMSFQSPLTEYSDEYPEPPAIEAESFLLESSLIGSLKSLLSLTPDNYKKMVFIPEMLYWVRVLVEKNEFLGMAGFSHRLGFIRQATNAPDMDVLVSRRFIQAIAKADFNQVSIMADEVFSIKVGSGLISAESPQTRIVGRTGEGSFPPFQSLEIREYESEFVVTRKAILNAIASLAIVVDDKRPGIRFTPNKTGFTVSPRWEILGNGSVEMPAEVQPGQGEILLNQTYLRDGLNFLDSEEIRVFQGKGGRVFQIKPAIAPDDGVEKVFLIAPYSADQDAPKDEATSDE